MICYDLFNVSKARVHALHVGLQSEMTHDVTHPINVLWLLI